MEEPKKKKKLKLNIEQIRELTDENLDNAKGFGGTGGSVSASCCNTSACPPDAPHLGTNHNVTRMERGRRARSQS